MLGMVKPLVDQIPWEVHYPRDMQQKMNSSALEKIGRKFDPTNVPPNDDSGGAESCLPSPKKRLSFLEKSMNMEILDVFF